MSDNCVKEITSLFALRYPNISPDDVNSMVSNLEKLSLAVNELKTFVGPEVLPATEFCTASEGIKT